MLQLRMTICSARPFPTRRRISIASTSSGPRLPQDVLAIEIRRRVGNGLAEQIVIRNCSMAGSEFVLRLEFGADFADVSEKDATPSHHGRTTSASDSGAQTITFEHHASHREHRFDRAL